MCIRDSPRFLDRLQTERDMVRLRQSAAEARVASIEERIQACLLYTSDAADERSSVDLGGRRIIKKKIIDHTYNRVTIQKYFIDH